MLLMIDWAVEIRGSEQHLGLVVDERHNTLSGVNRPSHYALDDRCFETRLFFLSRNGIRTNVYSRRPNPCTDVAISAEVSRSSTVTCYVHLRFRPGDSDRIIVDSAI